MHHVFRLNILCTILLIGVTGAASAQTSIDLGGMAVDPEEEIEVTSQTLSVDQETGFAIFEGDVVVIQGELRMSAERVEVLFIDETNEISRLIATGGVLLANAEDEAEADRADYDITTSLLTLTGDVLVNQGETVVSAESMVVNVTDGSATMQGRVRTVLQQGGN